MNNNFIYDVPEFNDGDNSSFLQTLNGVWPDNFVTDFSASQEIPKLDANICPLRDDVTFNTSELLSQVPNTDRCNVLDDDFFNLPAFDESILESTLPEIEPETNTTKQQPADDDQAIQSDGFWYDSGSNYNIPHEYNNNNNYNFQHNEKGINDFPLPSSGADVPDLSPMVLAGNLAIIKNPLELGFSCEPAGLKEVEELARASMEQIDPNCIGWNAPIFSTHLMDWGISHQNARAPHSLCQSCQLMRRIIHSNGVQDSRLEIHGLHGQPHHAVSECRPCVDDGKESSLNREMIEFPTRNLEHVKQFVAQYNHVRRSEGSVLRHDTFLMNALTATASDKPNSGWPGWDINSPVSQYNPVKISSNQRASSTSDYLPKSSYSAQRQRTGKIQMSELAKFFHLPITEAAKHLRICPTVIKKICRRNSLRRWPHRKIKSIERLIQSLELSLSGGNGEINESVRNQIVSLKNEQARLYGGFVG